jgi:hypothetical protein
MTGLRVAAGAAVFVGCVLAAAPAIGQSPVRIVVTFTEMRIGVAGQESHEATIEATLLGGNRITDADRRQRPGGGAGDRARAQESTFGSSTRPFESRRITATWRVGENNTLVRTLVRRNDVETTTVSLTGAKECTAAVTFRLKPGRTTHVRRGGKDRFKEVRAENISCSISD